MSRFPTAQKTSASTIVPKANRIEREPLSEVVRFKPECQGTVCLLHVSGEIDSFNSLELDAAIAGVAQAHRGALTVSFVDCSFADCSCLRVLIRQFKLLGARLSIVAPPASALGRHLDITHLITTLPVHGSLREAYLAISSDPRGSLGDLALWHAPHWKPSAVA